MKQSPDHMEDSDVSLERQRVVTGEAENEALVLYNLTKVSAFWCNMVFTGYMIYVMCVILFIHLIQIERDNGL